MKCFIFSISILKSLNFQIFNTYDLSLIFCYEQAQRAICYKLSVSNTALDETILVICKLNGQVEGVIKREGGGTAYHLFVQILAAARSTTTWLAGLQYIYKRCQFRRPVNHFTIKQ